MPGEPNPPSPFPAREGGDTTRTTPARPYRVIECDSRRRHPLPSQGRGTGGYGNALMGGIAAARGRYVIMGDADDSYDFREVPQFVERLRAGNDLVQGCRLPSGGGTVRPGAMPFLHRRIGNPLFSFLVRTMF